MIFRKTRLALAKEKLENAELEYTICKESGNIEQMIKEEETIELLEYQIKQLEE